MRRISILVVLLSLAAVSLMAGDMTNAQPASDLNAVVAASDQAQPAAEAPAAPKRVIQSGANGVGGTLFKSIFGEGLYKKTGIMVENWIQMGCATNTAVDHYAGNQGAGNWPDPVVNDSGCAMQDLDLSFHRDLVSNLAPGVGPIPGPTPKGFSWGFYTGVMWGRSSQPASMMGFDKQWSVNDPGDYNATLGAETRQYFLSTPVMQAQVYIPLWQGMELTFGRMGASIGWEIPPTPLPGPDFFASKDFALVSEPSEFFGLKLSANLLRSQKLGYIMGEFGVNNGWQTYHPVSGTKDLYAGMFWRSPKGSTGVHYSAEFGPRNLQPGPPCTTASGLCSSNLEGPGTIGAGSFYTLGTAVNGTGTIPAYVQTAAPSNLPAGILGVWGNGGGEYYGSYYHIISPNSQESLQNAITIYHNFGPKWKWVGEFNYGKQWGDGAASTLEQIGPNHFVSGFKGAEWGGVMSFVTYQFKPKWAVGIRGEHFKNQDGIGMYPTCGFYGAAAPGADLATCRTNLDDITLGLHYMVNRHAMLYPELRYDWQDDNHGLAVFGVNNLNVAYPLTATGATTAAPTSSVLPAAAALSGTKSLSQNYNAHTHDLVASMNVMVYF